MFFVDSHFLKPKTNEERHLYKQQVKMHPEADRYYVNTARIVAAIRAELAEPKVFSPSSYSSFSSLIVVF